ncbi:MAG: arylsulfatase A-like enzyme [Myxococcota bacterium]
MLRAVMMTMLVGCTGTLAEAPPSGLIVVSIDTLRVDHVGSFGGREGLTPNLDALAAESVRFTDAYAAANETLFSHGALFTGRQASHVAPVDYDFTIPEAQPTLASVARKAGWRTGAAVASGHLARIFGLDVGFDDYVESRYWGSFFQTIPLATRWLDRHLTAPESTPFLLFVHSYDCHSPYTKPGPLGRLASPGYQGPMLGVLRDPLLLEKLYRDRYIPSVQMSRLQNRNNQQILAPDIYAQLKQRYEAGEGTPLTDKDRAFIAGLYDTAIRYADMQLGVLIEALDDRGLLDTATVVVLSDHGEGLLEHDTFSHRGTLRDAELHVPLLVRPPGGLPDGGRTVDATFSLIDLAPTLLSDAGLPIPQTMEGRDRSDCLRGPCPDDGYAISEAALDIVSVTDGTHRLLVTDGVESLYDADDKPVDTPEAAQRLRAILEERL